jgi:hypothetical protein
VINQNGAKRTADRTVWTSARPRRQNLVKRCWRCPGRRTRLLERPRFRALTSSARAPAQSLPVTASRKAPWCMSVRALSVPLAYGKGAAPRGATCGVGSPPTVGCGAVSLAAASPMRWRCSSFSPASSSFPESSCPRQRTALSTASLRQAITVPPCRVIIMRRADAVLPARCRRARSLWVDSKPKPRSLGRPPPPHYRQRLSIGGQPCPELWPRDPTVPGLLQQPDPLIVEAVVIPHPVASWACGGLLRSVQ